MDGLRGFAGLGQGGLMLHKFIEPTGIATFVSLAITAFLGLALWKLRWVKFRPRYHYAMAMVTLILALTHLALNLLVH